MIKDVDPVTMQHFECQPTKVIRRLDLIKRYILLSTHSQYRNSLRDDIAAPFGHIITDSDAMAIRDACAIGCLSRAGPT